MGLIKKLRNEINALKLEIEKLNTRINELETNTNMKIEKGLTDLNLSVKEYTNIIQDIEKKKLEAAKNKNRMISEWLNGKENKED